MCGHFIILEVKYVPSIKILEEKKDIVKQLADKMQNSIAGVFVDYSGITVEDDTKLRRDLRDAGVEYSVVKNTLTRFAANTIGFEALDQHLHGTTALAVSTNDDVISAAKILCEYAKSNENFTIKIGFLEGKIIEASEVKSLASLPSKEQLIGQVLYGFNFPITGLAIALNAIKEKKEAEANTPAAPVETKAKEEIKEEVEAPQVAETVSQEENASVDSTDATE